MSVAAADLRIIALVGHPSAGKTTLIDALAFQLGASDRKGSVADKTSVLDTEPEEQEKGHTLLMKSLRARHGAHVLHLLDTPGYADFAAEAEAAIYASDLCIGVVSATSGVTHNLRQRMRSASELHRGRALLVTHLDAEIADFDALVAKLQAAIGPECVPVLVPDRSGPKFSAVRDVLGDATSPWRSQLMDRAMDACEDEALLAAYLESGELDDAQLHEHLPRAIEKGSLVPVLVCNPASGLGLDQVLHFISEYAPSPATLPSFRTTGAQAHAIEPDPAAPLLGIVCQVRSDPHVGKVCVARILRGQLRASDHVAGPGGGHGKGEKLGGLFNLLGGKRREPVEHVGPGELVALTKVEQLRLGQSFALAGHEPEPVEFHGAPEPMVALAVHPKARADEQKIGDALHKLAAEDPSFRVTTAPATHELIVHGMSELHLKVMESRLKRRFGVEITTSIPRIAYHETILKPADGHWRHKKQSGGRGQFGECFLRVRPGAKGAGVVFLDKVVGGSVPRNFIPAVEKGVRELAGKGVLTASTVVDVEVELYDGKYHDVDSDEASFKIAGARAFREAFLKATPALLEPIMEVEVHLPTHEAGPVFSDLTSHRRAHVLAQESEGDGLVTVIRAHAPLSALQTYQRDLKSQTAGEGHFTMKLAHYGPVPAAEQQRIVAQFGHKHEAEE